MKECFFSDLGMVVKRFTSLGLVGRGQESEEEEMGRTEEDEGDIITDNLGHIGRSATSACGLNVARLMSTIQHSAVSVLVLSLCPA